MSKLIHKQNMWKKHEFKLNKKLWQLICFYLIYINVSYDVLQMDY